MTSSAARVVQGLLAAQRRSGETGCLYASLHQCLPHGQRAVWDPEGGGNPVLIYNKDLVDKPLDSLQARLDY